MWLRHRTHLTATHCTTAGQHDQHNRPSGLDCTVQPHVTLPHTGAPVVVELELHAGNIGQLTPNPMPLLAPMTTARPCFGVPELPMLFYTGP